jgi:hypothetical protein
MGSHRSSAWIGVEETQEKEQSRRTAAIDPCRYAIGCVSRLNNRIIVSISPSIRK